MLDKEMKDKLRADVEQIEKIRQQIFKMANSYGGDDFGHIAQLLHGVCNSIITANHKMVTESVRESISAAEVDCARIRDEMSDEVLDLDCIDYVAKSVKGESDWPLKERLGSKDQTSGYFDLIAGRGDSKDEFEDIDNDEVVDKMILDGENFESDQT